MHEVLVLFGFLLLHLLQVRISREHLHPLRVVDVQGVYGLLHLPENILLAEAREVYVTYIGAL